jgi:hypothetical protein
MKYKVHNTKYDTYPVFAHHPYLHTEKSVFWEKLMATRGPILGFACPPDTTFVTWNDSDKKGLLEKQYDKLGVPHLSLGRGPRWKTNRVKLTSLLAVIDAIRTKYIVGADCFDVLVTGSLGDLIERFERKQAKVVYNAAGWLFPSIAAHGPVEEAICGHGPFQYLNGGLFVGETEYVKDMLLNLPVDKAHPTSEQYLLKLLYHQRHPEIAVDWNCEMFQIIHLPRICTAKVEDHVELIELPSECDGCTQPCEG